MSLDRMSGVNDPGVTEEIEKLPCVASTTTRYCMERSRLDA